MIGTEPNNNNNNRKFGLNFYSSEQWETPYFKVREFFDKEEWKEAVQLPNTTNVSGVLKSVQFVPSQTVEPKNGKKWFTTKDGIKFLIEDTENQQAYFVEARLSLPIRGFINSLLTAKIWDYVKIETGVNKAWFKNLNLFNPKEQVTVNWDWWEPFTADKRYNWKFKHTDLPQIDKTYKFEWKFLSSIKDTIPKDSKELWYEFISADSSKLDKFLEKEINETFKDVKMPVSETKSDINPVEKETTDFSTDINVEDLPF